MAKKQSLTSKKTSLTAKYAMFCDYALVSNDGKFSFIGEFDRLYSTQETASLNKGFLVAKISGEPGTLLNLNVSLVNQGIKEELFKNSFEAKLDERGITLLIMEVSGLQFKEFGFYKALIATDDDLIVAVELEVIKIVQPQTTQS